MVERGIQYFHRFYNGPIVRSSLFRNETYIEPPSCFDALVYGYRGPNILRWILNGGPERVNMAEFANEEYKFKNGAKVLYGTIPSTLQSIMDTRLISDLLLNIDMDSLYLEDQENGNRLLRELTNTWTANNLLDPDMLMKGFFSINNLDNYLNHHGIQGMYSPFILKIMENMGYATANNPQQLNLKYEHQVPEYFQVQLFDF